MTRQIPTLPPDYLDQHGSIGAPDIRVQRGDVYPERRVELSPSGRVIAARTGHRTGQLGQLLARGVITALQHEAGERLARDHETSENGQRTVAPLNPDRVDGSAGLTQSLHDQMLRAIQAQRAFRAAMHSLAAPGLQSCVLAVVIRDQAPGRWAVAYGQHERVGAAFLREALAALATHYGIDHGNARSDR